MDFEVCILGGGWAELGGNNFWLRNLHLGRVGEAKEEQLWSLTSVFWGGGRKLDRSSLGLRCLYLGGVGEAREEQLWTSESVSSSP